MKYYALTMTVTHRIGDVEGFDTEAELNKFGVERSVFTDTEKNEREADSNTRDRRYVSILRLRDRAISLL